MKTAISPMYYVWHNLDRGLYLCNTIIPTIILGCGHPISHIRKQWKFKVKWVNRMRNFFWLQSLGGLSHWTMLSQQHDVMTVALDQESTNSH